MDSGGERNQDDMVKFENFLKENILKIGGGKFFESSVAELDKRFLEFVFKMPIFSLFDKLEVKKIHPSILEEYLKKHQKNIKNILKNTDFLYNLINAGIGNIVLLFRAIKDTQKKSDTVQQDGVKNFNLITQNMNAKSCEHDNALEVMEKQQAYLSDEFGVFNSLWTMISNSPQVNDVQIAILKAISKLFAETYVNTFRFQCLMAKQLELVQQASERADRLQSEKDDLNKQVSEAKQEAAVAEANINSLNKQLEDEKERANRLQEENKQLLEAKTNAAVATAKVGELKETIKAKDETVETQKQSIEMQKQSIERQKVEIEQLKQQNEKNRQENEKNRQENLQQQQQLDKQKKELEEERAQIKKLRQEVEKQKKENEEQLKKIETYNRINKTLTRQFGTSFSRSCQSK